MIIFQVLTLVTAIISAMGSVADKNERKGYICTLGVSGVLFILAYVAKEVAKVYF